MRLIHIGDCFFLSVSYKNVNWYRECTVLVHGYSIEHNITYVNYMYMNFILLQGHHYLSSYPYNVRHRHGPVPYLQNFRFHGVKHIRLTGSTQPIPGC